MLKINLGCGSDKRDGYKNIDIRDRVEADIVLDLEKTPYPFDENSVDEILAKDIIEHFSYRDTERIIREWYRILKIGGRLTVQTPDFEQIVAMVIAKQITGWWNVSYWLYGGQEYKENYHKGIFMRANLKSLLESIGFRVDNICAGGTNMVCEATKL